MEKREGKKSKGMSLRKWSFVALSSFLTASQLYAATPDRVAEVRKKLFPAQSDEQLTDGVQKYKGKVIHLAQEGYYDYYPGSNLPYIPDYYAYSAYADYYNYSNYSDAV